MTDELKKMLKHLDDIVEMPQGVDMIRREVLRLAFSGRLVPQDPDEGDVEQLISAIEKEKADLVAEQKLRPSRGRRSRSTVSDHPFDIPDSWKWVDALSVCSVVVDGDHQPPPKTVSGVPFLVIGDVNSGVLNLEKVTRRVPVEYFRGLDWAHTPKPGDILYTTVGSFGIPVMVTGSADFCFQRHIALFRPVLSEMQEYLYRFLQSQFAFQYAASVATGIAQKTVPLSGLRSMPVPLPPLAEQRRIARRVDEIFDLIDQAEAAVRKQETARRAFTRAGLRSLASGGERTIVSFLQDVIREDSDTAELEDAILQLAVTGQLTRRHANDQSAHSLLEDAQSVALDPPNLHLGDDELSDGAYPLPAGWAWVSFGSVLTRIQAGWSPSAEPRPKEGDEWGVLKVSACSWGEYRPHENKALLPDQGSRPELEVQVGDFLISRANTSELVGRSVVVRETPPRLMLSDKTLRLSTVKGCNPRYLNLANLGPAARRHYEREATGTSSSMKNVSQRVIRRTPIPLPPREEQDRIVEVFDEMSRLLRRVRQAMSVVVSV
ncbi:restriction endonuclease subunit S [Streptomyces sp. GB4-14]|uniref:restriction endonuclease subunit S n=1 Tax=Streptomyces sp. GB4-14 TaxID=2498703 RepID=UPI001F5E8769